MISIRITKVLKSQLSNFKFLMFKLLRNFEKVLVNRQNLVTILINALKRVYEGKSEEVAPRSTTTTTTSDAPEYSILAYSRATRCFLGTRYSTRLDFLVLD